MDQHANAYALATLAEWASGHGIQQVRFALAEALGLAENSFDNDVLAAHLRLQAKALDSGPRPQGDADPELSAQRETEADEAALGLALGAELPRQGEVVITPEEKPAKPAGKSAKAKRAHEADGTFRGDDPSTPAVNEAFQGDAA